MSQPDLRTLLAQFPAELRDAALRLAMEHPDLLAALAAAVPSPSKGTGARGAKRKGRPHSKDHELVAEVARMLRDDRKLTARHACRIVARASVADRRPRVEPDSLEDTLWNAWKRDGPRLRHEARQEAEAERLGIKVAHQLALQGASAAEAQQHRGYLAALAVLTPDSPEVGLARARWDRARLWLDVLAKHATRNVRSD